MGKKNKKKFKKDFEGWCKLKKETHQKEDDKIVYFHEREIWWCSLGVNIGFEQDGKNEYFERPVLVLKKFNKFLLLIVPQTSKNKVGKYYHRTIHSKKDYYIILSQIRVISSKRLLRKITMVSKDEFRDVHKKIKSLL